MSFNKLIISYLLLISRYITSFINPLKSSDTKKTYTNKSFESKNNNFNDFEFKEKSNKEFNINEKEKNKDFDKEKKNKISDEISDKKKKNKVSDKNYNNNAFLNNKDVF